ncbi:MAG: hypothetical protein IAE67_01955 [Candidatus Competibacteraceae bacterium]|nr:hypothetical protein [Candidatus Competibacteraceae bacterium]
MSKRHKYIYVIFAVLSGAFAAFTGYVAFIQSDISSIKPHIELIIDADRASMMQVMIEESGQYRPEELLETHWNDPVSYHKIIFKLPTLNDPGKLRIDFGTARGNYIIHSIRIMGGSMNKIWKGHDIIKDFSPAKHIDSIYVINDKKVRLVSGGPDAILETKFQLSSMTSALNNANIVQWNIIFFAGIIGLFISVLSAYVLIKTHPFQYNRLQLAYVCTFLLLILAPGIKMIIRPESSTDENRKLAAKPVFSIDQLFGYPKKFTRYFADNMGFRAPLTTGYNYFQFKFFRSSAYPEKVIVGKNSWLYSSDHEISGDYRNLKLFTKEQLLIIKQNLEELHKWYASKGIKFYLMIAPSKFRLYPEYMPRRIKIRPGQNKLDQLLDYMHNHSDVPIITAHEEMLKAKINAEVFYAHDTHWNFEGGYIGYQKLMKTLQADFPQLTILPPDHFSRRLVQPPTADLSKMLALQSVLLNDEWTFEFRQIPPALPAPDVEFQSVYPFSETKFFNHYLNPTLPRIVMYRDSFSNLLMPFLIHHFGRSIFIWTYEHSLEVTEKEKPDIVVMEIVEYRLDRLLEKNPIDFRLTP